MDEEIKKENLTDALNMHLDDLWESYKDHIDWIDLPELQAKHEMIRHGLVFLEEKLSTLEEKSEDSM